MRAVLVFLAIGTPCRMPARPSEKPARYQRESKALAQRVQMLRHARGWTLEQTAERMDIDLRHLQRLEAGDLNLTFLTLVRVAEGFALELRDLF